MPSANQAPLPSTPVAEGQRPLNMAARRTRSASIDAASAIASAITPSSAPCRSSPTTSRFKNDRSSSELRKSIRVNASRRAVFDPAPLWTLISVSVRSTSRTDSGAPDVSPSAFRPNTFA